MTERFAAVEALLSVGRPGQARAELAGYLAEHPHDDQALRLLARCHDEAGEYSQMLDAARAAVAARPDSYEGHILLTLALSYHERADEAARAAEQALRLVPDGWAAHLLYGLALCGTGRRRAGMASVDRAVVLAPGQPYAHYVRGRLLHGYGRPRSAARSYRQALRLSPGHADAQRGLGQLALSAGRFTTAVRHFSGAAATRPGIPGAEAGLTHAFLGLADLGLGLAWLAMLALVWAMVPAAWIIAGTLAAGYAVLVGRFWARLPAGGRLLLSGRVRADPRCLVRVVAFAALVAGGLVLGVHDAGLPPGRTDLLVAPLVAVALAPVPVVLALLVARRYAVPDYASATDEEAARSPDETLRQLSTRLAERVLLAGWVPTALMLALAMRGVAWLPRAATGTLLIVAYAWVSVRIRNRLARRPGRYRPLLARMMAPYSLGIAVVLMFLPTAAYWPGTVPVAARLAGGGALVLVGAGWLAGSAWLVARRLGRRVRLRPGAGRPAA